ncbi:MAG: hypothetical protein UT48_C0002G0038 [Parcubacteria group bacterium GW2011_GWE2_39_37]|uniref:2TM domain-containing protein n=1 Tax=Candidatus Falkowbacteria bacterium GW2011_GWF2_39_8 TaxID=1618642 RepID=A0A0G0PV15_9BACT|nr:MAG: hypothetical protein UT48_C0002G0038 [Parcubacteria group bacterium GW2011_GWE2_39_37]KKR31738.1 MAG: hypothetical protein UT64_C0052G0001 [Candidatus Falkowbacteria bacterium GW2011_GWF2_39_8]
MENIETRISKIEERNKNVESDKAWETSWTRKTMIVLFTYLVIGLYLTAISVVNPWINAIVPVIGFILSTISLNKIKYYWVKKWNKTKA